MEPIDPDQRRGLKRLAEALPILEAPTFVAGHWHRSTQGPDGAWSMPWFELSDDGEAVRRAIAESGLVTPFDWMAWAQTDEAQALRTDREVLARATLDDLHKLLTTIIRADRFSEGTLAEAFESGLIAAIARRAAVLAEDM